MINKYKYIVKPFQVNAKFSKLLRNRMTVKGGRATLHRVASEGLYRMWTLSRNLHNEEKRPVGQRDWCSRQKEQQVWRP